MTFTPITGGDQSIYPTPTAIEGVLRIAFGFLTIAGGILFVIWLIVGGYNWMTSEGKPDKLEKARDHIIQAITGLVILIGAYAISAVLGSILGLDIFNLRGLIDSLK